MVGSENSWWICTECEGVFQAETPPGKCPNCGKECVFSDVTCYIPECGGPRNVDVRLVAARMAEDRNRNR
jgi:rubredoxin